MVQTPMSRVRIQLTPPPLVYLAKKEKKEKKEKRKKKKKKKRDSDPNLIMKEEKITN